MSYDPNIGRWISEDPIAFDGGDPNLDRYVGNSPTNYTDPTGLYDEDIHFYMTYYLAIAVGIPTEDAFDIAWAAQYVDYNDETEPFGTTSVQRRFHFRCSAGNTVAGSDEAAEIVDDAISQADSSPLLMGIGLHIYEDSWSHEGFAPGIGHVFRGHAPDEPFRDTNKAMAMAEAVYTRLVAWRDSHYPGRKAIKSFGEIRDTLEGIMGSPGDEEQRSEHWRGHIRQDFGIDVLSTAPNAARKRRPVDPKRVEQFLECARTVKEPTRP